MFLEKGAELINNIYDPAKRFVSFETPVSGERGYICRKRKRRNVKFSIILIQGLVQGVGFRPFIYRVATEMGIRGEVENRTDGVYIRALLTPAEKEVFIRRIYKEHPPVASIHRIQEWEEETNGESEEEAEPGSLFCIKPSRPGADEITQVAPDIAVCPACLEDRRNQPHRLDYPFINCTHCGPRFSIVSDLPYDRGRTTMRGFEMCPVCRTEYTTVADRRFHAQPVACNQCGPFYYATYRNHLITDYGTLLSLTSRLLREGEVIAAKGIGGYHLVCNALNEEAVSRLRKVKRRDTKPLAVMFRDIESLEKYAYLGEAEKNVLISWRRPIVLLKERDKHLLGRGERYMLEQKEKRSANVSLPSAGEIPFVTDRTPLAAEVHPGMKTVGCMLPYMPIHFDWFAQLDTPALVMTSANRSDLPIAITPEEAEAQLQEEVALILHHNREIYNRVDDSVLQICGSQPCLIRRSRGYVPEPFFADTPVEGMLAFGAEKVSTFALGKGDTILQSQYIGDLKNWETFRFYTESLERFQRLFRFTPRQLVCDLHPDYLSSQEAERMARTLSIPLKKVQHHHAHAAACLLEYGLFEPVVALVMDGTGSGDDGKSWGGEFLWCDRTRYRRLSHLEYVPLPGGDKASTEPWRMAVSYLAHYALPLPADLKERVGDAKIRMLQNLMEKGVQCPFTSSAGRLFDAVASLLGICDISTRQAEAAILLEQAAMDEEVESYPFVLSGGTFLPVGFLFQAILEDLNHGISVGRISARFHATFARLLVEKALECVRLAGVKKVIVSGGCFQNKRLTETIQRLFAPTGISLYVPSRIPCNDSGIAAGQIAVAAACLYSNC